MVQKNQNLLEWLTDDTVENEIHTEIDSNQVLSLSFNESEAIKYSWEKRMLMGANREFTTVKYCEDANNSWYEIDKKLFRGY